MSQMLFNKFPFSINVNEFKQISDGIWVYKNFVSDKECDLITESASKVPEHMWFERDWYKSTKKQINELIPIHKKINSILQKDFNIGENFSVVKFIKGQTWYVHKDNFDSLHILESNLNIKEGDSVYPAEYTTHGVILYFNDHEGAEIYYPEIGIRYKPEKGDMLVHRSDIAHEVLTLKSDIRYSHSNKIFIYLDAPLGVK